MQDRLQWMEHGNVQAVEPGEGARQFPQGSYTYDTPLRATHDLAMPLIEWHFIPDGNRWPSASYV